MINFKRYPHVKDFIEYYAKDLDNQKIIELLEIGINNQDDAEILSHFTWSMVDKMLADCDDNKSVLGQIDNSDVFPDLQYEITLYLNKLDYMDVWNRVRDQENPKS